MSKTCISAGEVIRHLLTSDATVNSLVTKIYPVIEDNAQLPYVVYRRSGMQQSPIKHGMGADAIMMQVICYAKDYGSSVELAEAVRQVLDNAPSTSYAGITMRSCLLTDCQEGWKDDAYIQNLIFTIKA